MSQETGGAPPVAGAGTETQTPKKERKKPDRTPDIVFVASALGMIEGDELAITTGDEIKVDRVFESAEAAREWLGSEESDGDEPYLLVRVFPKTLTRQVETIVKSTLV